MDLAVLITLYLTQKESVHLQYIDLKENSQEKMIYLFYKKIHN